MSRVATPPPPAPPPAPGLPLRIQAPPVQPKPQLVAKPPATTSVPLFWATAALGCFAVVAFTKGRDTFDTKTPGCGCGECW